MKLAKCCVLFLLGCQACQADVIRIYLDADFSNNAESANAISMGMQTALSEVGSAIQGRKVEVVAKDHRGNSLRSLRHMQQFLADESALFMLGGMHSPPYIQHRDFINKNEVLLLVAWAAGGPITRYPSDENWVFRLSIDDTKAGARMAQYALDEKQCEQPHLLVENTPWGKSNFSALSEFSKQRQGANWSVTWFGWNTGYNQARTILRNIQSQGADCIIYVGNNLEGEQFAKANVSLMEPRPAIVSHWGITGGDFQQRVGPDLRSNLDLNFIQTCYSFLSPEQPQHAQQVFSRAKALFPEVLDTPGDMPAPAGFVHAFDIGRLVIKALDDVSISQPMADSRRALRVALESLEEPVPGLVKTYQKPFTSWSEQRPDAHEALGLDDICMARFNESNQIILH